MPARILWAIAVIVLACALAPAETPKKAEAPAGILKVATPGMVLKLRTNIPTKVQGKMEEIAIPPEKEVRLPPGRYETASIELYVQDDQKQVWSLEATKDFGKLQAVDIVEGQTTTVEGGGPLTVKPTYVLETEKEAAERAQGYRSRPGTLLGKQGVAKGAVELASSNRKTLSIEFVCTGKAGEKYSLKAHKGKALPPAPKVQVLDEKGTVLGQGPYQFGYTSYGTSADAGGSAAAKAYRTRYPGSSDKSGSLAGTGYQDKQMVGKQEVPDGFYWSVPGGFKGKVKAEVALAGLGPFEWKQEEAWYEVK